MISSSPQPHGGSITTVGTKPKTGRHEVLTGIFQYLYYLVPLLLVLLLLLTCVLCWTYRAQKKIKEQRREEGQDSDGVTYAAVAWKGGRKPAEKAPKERSVSHNQLDNDDVTYAAVTWKSGKTPAETAPKERSNDEEVLYDGTKGSTVDRQNDDDVLYVSMKRTTVDKQ
ncbi:Translation initiation factor IF-1, chloroplastic, partial [Clarias magur]